MTLDCSRQPSVIMLRSQLRLYLNEYKTRLNCIYYPTFRHPGQVPIIMMPFANEGGVFEGRCLPQKYLYLIGKRRRKYGMKSAVTPDHP